MNPKIISAVFLLIMGTVLFAFVKYPRSDVVQVIACDVGQGDGFLIIHKSYQILIDGGADSQILTCLSKYLPFWDRVIELLILTHPQEDHYRGLIDVFERYNVQNFLLPQIDSSNESFRLLKNSMVGEGANVTFAHSGQKVRVGLIYLEILWPDMRFFNGNLKEGDSLRLGDKIENLYQTEINPNNLSVVFKARYKNFDMLFTGDIEPTAIEKLLGLVEIGDVEYLKVPHHGSRNGLTKDLLKFATPEIAVISVARNNSYGHPHQEILEMLNQYAKVFRTDLKGDVVVLSDGNKIWVK
ncbi:MAG: MBL fold metallo-hydrolase [Patescibacteria group bacterium]|nr:MBL fold metallo-hydrolase [Patescibacteria group bacterium]MCX7928884.1 MBL fold metallo-hydrolase [Patescibacteria group bacterium]